jgi:hypothetical protein
MRRLTRHWPAAAVGSIAAVAVFLIFGGGTEAPHLDFPAFTMEREMTTGAGTPNAQSATFRLEYVDSLNWKDTVLTTTAGRAGEVLEFRDGRRVVADGQLAEHEGGLPIPGPWFLSQAEVVAIAEAGGQQHTIEMVGDTIVVEVDSSLDITTYVFDADTGIPLEYKVSDPAGRVGLHIVVTSLVLADGTVIR